MKTLHMDLKEHGYDILLGQGLLSNADKYLNLNRKVLIITDDGVPSEFSEVVASKSKDAKIVTFKQGEASKNVDTWSMCLKEAADFKMSRKDVVVAIGGGVVGDLAGFVAASYMRGVDFYNIPTTTLSQIDSSIGGKVAVDLDGIKNIVGAFYQPKKVLIDLDTLKTLDIRQVNNGLAEAIKTGLIGDPSLFELLEKYDGRKHIEEVIYRCLCFKKYVVEVDEKETGLRKILNYGHTIGHAIETCSNGELIHGEAVGIGMLKIIDDKNLKDRVLIVLTKYALPIDFEYDKNEVFEILTHDKKGNGDSIDVIYVNEIGKAQIQNKKMNELKELL